MPRAADTNVIVCLIVQDDARQLALARARAAGGLWISHVVLVEVIWVLDATYGLSRAALVTTLELLLDQPELAIQDPDVVRAAVGQFRQRRAVDFSDCLILEIARKAGQTPLLTFDRALAKLDGAQLVSG